MAWTAPMTASAGALSAAQWNQQVRDNLLETEAAKAVTTGSYIAQSDTNQLAERTLLYDVQAGNTVVATTTWTSLGTAISTTSATVNALVLFAGRMNTTIANAQADICVSLDAAPTATDEQSMISWSGFAAANNNRASGMTFVSKTPGAWTLTMFGRVSSGSCTFSLKELVLIPH